MISRSKRTLAGLLLVVPLISTAAPALEIEADSAVSSEILDRYFTNSQAQQSGLRGVQMDVEIDASLPKLKKTGKMQALRSISKLGHITYQGLKFIGDQTIKTDVIARYLTAEKQTQEMDSVALTPKNYKFKYKGQIARNGHLIHVFQVVPKKKAIGLFRGELWVDSNTYLPVRESGRFVKNPSMFLKKIEFVRDYEIRDGVAFPKHIESSVDTRFWGPAQMSINFTNVSRQETADTLVAPVNQVSQ